MTSFKCKMCGGTVSIIADEKVGTCDSCGTLQTLISTGNPTIENLFNRANALRQSADFDKAEELFEKIIEQDDSQAEAHWGLILCKYGVEYVDDPRTHRKIPTCHRTQYEPVTSDAEFAAALSFADFSQQSIYKEEARKIDIIQKGILNIVRNEEPFDVFICYKETDENGKRTQDSVIANDIYYQLTEEGYKVFYAPITLEDKLGQEYEPYIFAALSSSRVMLAIGTQPEYFSAVWVRNEWSRFLKLSNNDRKRLLIPCYRGFDPYQLPQEFAYLQAQDMSKIGFINDVIRGIKKVIVRTEYSEEPKNEYRSYNPKSTPGYENKAETPLNNIGFKQNLILSAIKEYNAQNPFGNELAIETQRENLIRERNCLAKFPVVRLVLMILGFWFYVIPGFFFIGGFRKAYARYKEDKVRADIIDRRLAELNNALLECSDCTVEEYVRMKMQEQGIPVSDDEIKYCLLTCNTVR